MKRLIEENDGFLIYNGYKIYDLAKEYGTPLRITFLDIIKDRIESLRGYFNEAKNVTNYQGDIVLLNANKANYGYEEIKEAYQHSNGLEVSSYYDLLYTKKMFDNHNDKDKYIVLNGYKPQEYLDLYIKMSEEGYNIIDIIDNIEEYNYLKSKNSSFNIGLRIHLKSLYHDDPSNMDDRFGLKTDEIDYILSDLKETKLSLKVIHYHQRGFDYERDKFLENFQIALNCYIKIAKEYPSLNGLDIGGGTPLPISEDFNYSEWAKEVLGLIKKVCTDNCVPEPKLFLENGKYNQKDSTINIYKVIGVKNTNAYPWYIVDGCLLIAMPEMYALDEPMNVRPINNLQNDKANVILAGNTCDCDDIYYIKDKGYFEIPIGNESYIAILGTGSYQDSMNGKGGLHHCLLPEEKSIVIKNGEITIRKELQKIEDIYKIINF